MSELLAAAALIITVLVTYLQIQKGQRAALAAQQAHLRDQLKVQLYEKVAQLFGDCAQTVNNASNDVQSVIGALRAIARDQPGTRVATSAELISSNSEAHHALTKVLLVLEQYEMAFANFGAIRRQFSDDSKILLDVHTTLWVALVLYVPIVSGVGSVSSPSFKPDAAAITKLEPQVKAYVDVCGDILGHFIDLQVAAQNELLGNLFEHQLPPRNPADPKQKVLLRDAGKLAVRPSGRIV